MTTGSSNSNREAPASERDSGRIARPRLGRAARKLSHSRGRAHARRGPRLVQAAGRVALRKLPCRLVVSAQSLRPHFHAIYAYCRVSDDLGDEVGDTAQSLALLDFWGRELDACYEGRARHPVFVALAETIRACSIPKEPFADLLTAFRQDQTVTRYADHGGCAGLLPLLGQSRGPSGALRLRLRGRENVPPLRRNLLRAATGQLLAGCARGLRQGPRLHSARRHAALSASPTRQLPKGIATPEFRALMRVRSRLCARPLQQGLPLIGMVDRDLALDLDLFSRGGLEILRAIERAGL